MSHEADCPYCGAFAVKPPGRPNQEWLWQLPRTSRLAALEARLSKMEDDYYELLFAVVKKHEGETRHETALRYITEHENRPARETLAGESDAE